MTSKNKRPLRALLGAWPLEKTPQNSAIFLEQHLNHNSATAAVVLGVTVPCSLPALRIVLPSTTPQAHLRTPMSSFFRALFRPAPTLRNTGSTARDHLASERTFLAWTRTGLGFTALGIALERFSALDPSLRDPYLYLPQQQAQHDSPRHRTEDGARVAETEARGIDRVGPSTTNLHSSTRRIKTPSEVEAEREREHLLVGALLGLGAGSIVYATVRYFSNLRLLEQGLFRPSYWGAAGMSVGVAGLVGGAYVGALRERIKGREGFVFSGRAVDIREGEKDKERAKAKR